MLMGGLLPLADCGDAVALCGVGKTCTVGGNEVGSTVGTKMLAFAPAAKCAWAGAATLPASSKPVRLNLDGTVRSSSASTHRSVRGGALRIVRVTGRANRLRTRDRIVMRDSNAQIKG